MTNLLEVTKPEVLDNALKEKDDRLNVLFFWADWHEPCHLVAKIVDQLAKENPTAVFLKVRFVCLSNSRCVRNECDSRALCLHERRGVHDWCMVRSIL